MRGWKGANRFELTSTRLAFHARKGISCLHSLVARRFSVPKLLSLPKYLIIPLHLTQISSRRKAPLKQNKTKQKQVSGRHGTLSIISLYTGLGKYFPKCVLWDTMVCQTLIFIPLNREKGFVMKFLGRLSGSNRFICCYVFKPLIPNVDYKYLKEGCRLCFFSRALGHFFRELLL